MKIKFKNKSTLENTRVKIVPRDGATITLTDQQSNPTVTINDGLLTFCLSPVQGQVVGNDMYFEYFENTVYKITVNDVVVHFDVISSSTLPEFSDISIEFSHDMIYILVRNISNNDIRVEVNAFSEGNKNFIFDPQRKVNTNPTVIYEDHNNDGSYSKISAYISSFYPPYAAFETKEVFGSLIPAIIKINGNTHEGNLYGDLGDILAEQYNIFTGFQRTWDYNGEEDGTLIIFCGDIYAENFIIELTLNINSEANIDDYSQRFPVNFTAKKISHNKFNFKIGKLVCSMGIHQHGDANFGMVEFNEFYDYKVSQKITSPSITLTKRAGDMNGDPTTYCADTYDPESCVRNHLSADLAAQWNPELKEISATISEYNQNLSLQPYGKETTRMVVHSFNGAIDLIDTLGYVIPVCATLG